MNSLFAVFLLSLAHPGTFQEKLEYELFFSDSKVGNCIYSLDPDGSFRSETKITITPVTIHSTLQGRFSKGKLSEYILEQQIAETKSKVVAKDNQVKVEVGDNTVEREYASREIFFANYHPATWSTLAKVLAKSQDPSLWTSSEVFQLDNAGTFKFDIKKIEARTIEIRNKKEVVEKYLIRAETGVDIEIYLDEKQRLVGLHVPAQRFTGHLKDYKDLVVDPTTKYPELSQPIYRTKIERGVKIKMRDGVELVADIAYPEAEEKFPAILVRTPYGREEAFVEAEWWAKRGYVYIAQDCRGRNDSGGEWIPFVNERKDGYDTIDWISKQTWSNGNVGMIGGSYGGWVQWWAAVEAHPALKCIIPQVSPPDPFFNIPYDYGIFFLYGSVWWANIVRSRENLKTIDMLGSKLEKFKTLPLSKVDDEIIGQSVSFYDEWLSMETRSAFGSANFMNDLKKVKIPVLHVSGWWDGDGIGTKLNWETLRSLGHKQQWLIYGPWTHAFNSTSRLGDVDYGPDAVLELNSLWLRWFDTWLKGKEVGFTKVPKVRVFVTGKNKWREFEDWPAPKSQEKVFYLDSKGPANGNNSLGTLSENPPQNSEPDRYTYNPADARIPPEIATMDPSKISTIFKLEDTEQDILIYKSEPLSEGMEFAGPAELEVHFSTSALDTDFFWMIVDIDEKGTMRMIGLPGKIRAKYLTGWDKPKLLKPGRIYKAKIPHWEFAHYFEKGHRIGVIITSDMFPEYARNLNTGEPIKDAVRMVAAHQTIYHDRKHPSVLRFQVLPKEK